jgi:hypothetical protein
LPFCANINKTTNNACRHVVSQRSREGRRKGRRERKEGKKGREGEKEGGKGKRRK